MSEELERRQIWMLMVERAGTSLLVDRSGELPRYVIELQGGESTLAAVRRAVFPRLGVAGPFLDLRVDHERAQDAQDDGVLGTLVELSSPPVGWDAPDDFGVAPVGRCRVDDRRQPLGAPRAASR